MKEPHLGLAFSGGSFSRFPPSFRFFLALLVTYLVKLQKIVSRTDQSPLASYFLKPPQEKLPESAGLLDLPEHRLNYTFSSRVNGRSTLVFSFRSIRSTRLASFGKGPRLHGSLRSPCFCFPVATNPSILLFARYFRFSSEQYPLSASTSSGFCPDCSWIAWINGTTCCLSLASGVTVCPTTNWKSGSTAICVLYPCTNPSDPFMIRDSGSVKLYWAFGSGFASWRSLPSLSAFSRARSSNAFWAS